MLLLPGGIDAHTDLDMPFGVQHPATILKGTRAAAIGGTTTIVDFAIQARGHEDARCSRHMVEEGGI